MKRITAFRVTKIFDFKFMALATGFRFIVPNIGSLAFSPKRCLSFEHTKD
jgi:hypothetical protein